MDALVDAVLAGVLGNRRRRSTGALRLLTRGVGRGALSHPGTLLGIAGVAWGIFETLQNRSAGAAVPPPIPATPTPPLANEEALRLVRLVVSAASADGTITEKERAAVIRQMTAAGAADLLDREFAQPRPLAEIVAGVSDEADRATLYVLAFTILRADERVSGAERIYLAQLATLLGLDPPLVAALEKDTGERIDALGDQGQLGG
jgi:uncharacterized membrane protein YebE (DUF533 family)